MVRGSGRGPSKSPADKAVFALSLVDCAATSPQGTCLQGLLCACNRQTRFDGEGKIYRDLRYGCGSGGNGRETGLDEKHRHDPEVDGGARVIRR